VEKITVMQFDAGEQTTYLIYWPEAQLSLILAILKVFPFRYCAASDYAS
jgi:hypothetical protein